MAIKNYDIDLKLRRFDDGWVIEASLPGRDQVKRHFPTETEMYTFLENNLPTVISDLESAFNPTS